MLRQDKPRSNKIKSVMQILAKEVNLSRSRFSGLDCKLPTDSQISICTNETIHIDDEVLLKTVELKTQKY